MAKKKKKKSKTGNTAVDAYLTIRQTWDISPVTHVKGDARKDASKKACRNKKQKGWDY